jgi:hypothetical protein
MGFKYWCNCGYSGEVYGEGRIYPPLWWDCLKCGEKLPLEKIIEIKENEK